MSAVSKRGWGTGIALLFGSFAVFILILVGFASLQKFHLVEKDYYNKELNYQETIDKSSRASQNPDGVIVDYEQLSKILFLTFPGDEKSGVIDGEITFFRPSDEALDFILPVKPDENNIQTVSTGKMAAGLWKVKIDWSIDTTEFYFEDILVIE